MENRKQHPPFMPPNGRHLHSTILDERVNAEVMVLLICFSKNTEVFRLSQVRATTRKPSPTICNRGAERLKYFSWKETFPQISVSRYKVILINQVISREYIIETSEEVYHKSR